MKLLPRTKTRLNIVITQLHSSNLKTNIDLKMRVNCFV